MECAKLSNAPEVTTLLPLVSEGPGQRSRKRKKHAFSLLHGSISTRAERNYGTSLSARAKKLPSSSFAVQELYAPEVLMCGNPSAPQREPPAARRPLLSPPPYSSASKVSPSWRADSFTEAKVGEFSVSSFACVENAVNSTLSLRLFSLSGTRKLL